uniref:Spectrin repeat containing nuclear envelope protein 2 n=1 Tax=Capra hircus TaxID=9925 RepID=A0A452F220_CAPHI
PVISHKSLKLKETFAFIQQLDKNMSNLRTWLARIESELSKPVVYDVCDDQEIQKRLAEQQVGKCGMELLATVFRVVLGCFLS